MCCKVKSTFLATASLSFWQEKVRCSFRGKGKLSSLVISTAINLGRSSKTQQKSLSYSKDKITVLRKYRILASTIYSFYQKKKSWGRTESSRWLRMCNLSYLVQEELFISFAIERFFDLFLFLSSCLYVIFLKEKSSLITSRCNVWTDTRKAFKMIVPGPFLTKCGGKIIYCIFFSSCKVVTMKLHCSPSSV